MKLSKVFAVVMTAWFATSCLAAEQLDQSYDVPVDSQNLRDAIYFVKVAAQTFTVGVSGTLSKVELAIQRSSDFPGSVSVDIARVVAGTPDYSQSGRLANQTLAVSSIPVQDPNTPLAKTFVPIDFSSSNLAVNAGDYLAIVLRPSYTGSNYIGWWENNSSQPSYEGGTYFTYDVVMQSGADIGGSINDAQFRTYVTTIPEPSTCVLLAGCSLAIGFTRRDRRR